MKSSYEKDLKSVNTRSNLYTCILILIEPASSQEVLNGTRKLKYGLFLKYYSMGGGGGGHNANCNFAVS